MATIHEFPPKGLNHVTIAYGHRDLAGPSAGGRISSMAAQRGLGLQSRRIGRPDPGRNNRSFSNRQNINAAINILTWVAIGFLAIWSWIGVAYLAGLL